MRLIVSDLMKLLLSEAWRGGVYVQGEIDSQQIKAVQLTRGRRFHLYCSPRCLGASALADEMSNVLGIPILWTDNLSELDQCEHFLLYLTSFTWTRGQASEAFACEVEEAQRLGVHLLLAHEFPCILEDDSIRGACAFGEMWNCGWTPKRLLDGDRLIYAQIATALKPFEWRKAGLAQLAAKLAVGGGERAQWRVVALAARSSRRHVDASQTLSSGLLGALGSRRHRVRQVALERAEVSPETTCRSSTSFSIMHRRRAAVQVAPEPAEVSAEETSSRDGTSRGAHPRLKGPLHWLLEPSFSRYEVPSHASSASCLPPGEADASRRRSPPIVARPSAPLEPVALASATREGALVTRERSIAAEMEQLKRRKVQLAASMEMESAPAVLLEGEAASRPASVAVCASTVRAGDAQGDGGDTSHCLQGAAGRDAPAAAAPRLQCGGGVEGGSRAGDVQCRQGLVSRQSSWTTLTASKVHSPANVAIGVRRVAPRLPQADGQRHAQAEQMRLESPYHRTVPPNKSRPKPPATAHDTALETAAAAAPAAPPAVSPATGRSSKRQEQRSHGTVTTLFSCRPSSSLSPHDLALQGAVCDDRTREHQHRMRRPLTTASGARDAEDAVLGHAHTPSLTDVRKLHEVGVDGSHCAASLQAMGHSARSLLHAGFTSSEMSRAGYDAADLRIIGCSAKELMAAGREAHELQAAGFPATEMLAAGFTGHRLWEMGYKLKELRVAGLQAAEMRPFVPSVEDLVKAGYTLEDLRQPNVGLSPAELSKLTNEFVVQAYSNPSR